MGNIKGNIIKLCYRKILREMPWENTLKSIKGNAMGNMRKSHGKSQGKYYGNYYKKYYKKY
jgi:hypothetical protein